MDHVSYRKNDCGDFPFRDLREFTASSEPVLLLFVMPFIVFSQLLLQQSLGDVVKFLLRDLNLPRWKLRERMRY